MAFIGRIIAQWKANRNRTALARDTMRIQRNNQEALDNGETIGRLPPREVIRRYGGYREYAQARGGPII